MSSDDERSRRAPLPYELLASDELLRVTTEMSGVAVWEYNVRENLMQRSANHDALYGLDWQNPWHAETFLDATIDEDRPLANRVIDESLAPGGPDSYEFDFRVLWPDQSIHWLCVRGRVVARDETGSGLTIRGVIFDVGDRKAIEVSNEELVKLYKTLSACNHATVNSHDESELFHRVCQAMVDSGHADAAWIGQFDNGRELVPVAWAGVGVEEFLAARQGILERNPAASYDLALISLNEGRIVWRRASTTLADDAIGQLVIKHHWASSESLPLKRDGSTVAVLTAYSRSELHFSEEIDRLLSEVSSDISYALENFSSRRQELRSREVATRFERNLNHALDQLHLGIYVIQDSRFSFLNDRSAKLLGFSSAKELIGRESRLSVPTEFRDRLDALIEKTRTNDEGNIDFTFETLDDTGRRIGVRARSIVTEFDGRPARIGVLTESASTAPED